MTDQSQAARLASSFRQADHLLYFDVPDPARTARADATKPSRPFTLELTTSAFGPGLTEKQGPYYGRGSPGKVCHSTAFTWAMGE